VHIAAGVNSHSVLHVDEFGLIKQVNLASSQEAPMHVLLATNDPVLLSFVSALLGEAGLQYVIADEHTSAIEGRIGAFPRRVMVAAHDADAAKRVLREADLGHELPTK
jgi:hypothetical protein